MPPTSSAKRATHQTNSQEYRDERDIRVLLLADDRITRAGLRILIDNEPAMSVIGEHSLIDDPSAMLSTAHPHIALMDVDRDSRDFVPALITRLSKKTRVIVLTSACDAEIASSIFWSGAKGLVVKDQAPSLLLKAIRKVNAGEVWLDRLTMARLLSELSAGEPGTADASRAGRLTLRERQLITILGQGFANGEIAEHLHISEATVRNHLTSIFKKLELHSRFELVMYALRQGLISTPQPAVTTPRAHRQIKSAS